MTPDQLIKHALLLCKEGKWGQSEAIARELPLSLPGVRRLLGWHALRHGNFQEGFTTIGPELGIYRSDEFYSLPKEKKLTRGTNVRDKRVLLALEGGFGDEVAWARAAQILSKRGAHTIVGTLKESETVLSRLLGAERVRRIDSIAPSEYDCYLLAMSSAEVLDLKDPKEGISFPYLSASEERRLQVRPLVVHAALNRLKIGVSWQGNSQFEHMEQKSWPASLLAPFSELGALFSLQRNAENNLPPEGVRLFDTQSGPPDWEHTLAVISEMDIVISGCTSIAHYAGALGKPVFIVVNHSPSYYWADLKPRTPWYPSARIFRQPTPGDWKGALAEVYDHIKTKKAGV